MVRLVLAVGIAAVLAGQTAAAGTYPTNKCVSTKQKEAGKYCKSALKAWAKWEQFQDDDKRDADILKAANKLDGKWTRAEGKASAKGAACADTTASSGDVRDVIDTEIVIIKDAINSGLDLGDRADAKCGQLILKAAGAKCVEFLKAESKYIRKLEKDPDGDKREQSQTKASTKFSGAWASAIAKCTNAPGTTEAAVEGAIDGISDEVVLNTTVSPNVDDTQFTTYSPVGTTEYQGKDLTPICIKGTPYHYFAKRGSTNKLLMYYQGGGACWENLTCFFETCDTNVNPAGGDNPNNWSTGFGDLSDQSNPFREWNIVFVPYCSCDIHFGDADQTYESDVLPDVVVQHHGYHNAKVVEKWAREHFVNPEVIFVTGSSAGAYGAVFQAPLLHEVWPASEFHVLGDAGNGVITPGFLQNEFNNWNFAANLPDYIPGVVEAMAGPGMPAYTEAVAAYFSETNWAHYTSAFDGGSGGQTGFYNLMLNDNDPTYSYLWWNASCEWNDVMRTQAFATEAAIAAANNNYRYYIGTGSQHTMFGHPKVYTDTTGGVPTIVDWVNSMMASDSGWVNVEASPFNVTLPGDPISQYRCGGVFEGDLCADDSECTLPDTCELLAPFEESGQDIVINCAPPSPSGAFLDAASGVLD
jgi:hypothetical protein